MKKQRRFAADALKTAFSANRLVRALNHYADVPALDEGALRRLIRAEIRYLMRCCVRLYLAVCFVAKKPQQRVAERPRGL